MRRGITLVAFLGLVACSDKGTTDVNTSVTGTYALQTINGSSLPTTLSSFGGAGGQDVIQSGTFALKADGTWTFTLNATSSGRQATVTRDCCYSGTWTQGGTTVTLQPSVANSWTGPNATVSGNNLTYAERGFVFVFKKS